MTQRRLLNPGEQRIMDIVNTFNKLTDDGAQYGTLLMTQDALRIVVRHGIANPLKAERDPVAQRIRVYFHICEYEKYVRFVCKQVGFTLLLNGGVRTEDGLNVEPIYPADHVKQKTPKKVN